MTRVDTRAFAGETGKYLAIGAAILVAGFLLLVSTARPVSAAVCTFSSSSTNSFNVAVNWSCGHVPTNGDDIVIPGNTTTFASGLTISVRSVSSTGIFNLNDSNLTASTTLIVSAGGAVTSTSGAITITTTTTNAGTVTSTSGVLTFTGAATSTGTGVLGSSSGNILFGASFNNSGIFSVGSGSATTTGNFTNSGTTNGGSGTLSILALFTNTGTFNPGTGTVRIAGSADQVIPVLTFTNLTLNSSGGTMSFLGDATTTGTLLYSSGTLSLGPGTLSLAGDFLEVGSPGGSASSGNVRLTGGANQSIQHTLFFNLIVNKTGGTATFSNTGQAFNGGITLLGGTLNAGTGVTTLSTNLVASPLLLAGGTFLHGGGTVSYQSVGGGQINVASTTFNNVAFAPFLAASTTYNLTGATNASGTTALTGANTTLAIGTNTLTAVGLITNPGIITLGAGGKIIHTAESAKMTDSAGVEVTSISTPGSMYVTVQDSNRNLLGATIETMTVPVTLNAAAGSDSETMTLTETSAASGIFRNASAVAVVSSITASPGNSQFEVVASGVGTSTYTDNQDAADIVADTVTLSLVAAGSGGGGGGGGGGLGAPEVNALPPSTPTFQTNLDNLKNLGVAVHSLIKLPDDNNPLTQHDTAVYYVGADGKRHAFPNDKVYFTWYTSFDGVQLIGDAQLASIPLGANVTYKPGKKMVKFTTDAKVYAVAKGGILRWVTTEAAAVQLYGAMWNMKIDDISDAFFANYSFGANVTGLADFNPAQVEASVTFPSDSLQM